MSLDSERGGGPYTNELGEAIYQRRTTVTALAEAIGLKRQDVSEMVNGWRLPSALQLDAMASFLGWSADRMYPREEFRVAIEATRQVVA